MGWCVVCFVVYGICYVEGVYDNIIKFPLLLYLGFLDYAIGCLLGSSSGFSDKFKDLTRKEEEKPSWTSFLLSPGRVWSAGGTY